MMNVSCWQYCQHCILLIAKIILIGHLSMKNMLPNSTLMELNFQSVWIKYLNLKHRMIFQSLFLVWARKMINIQYFLTKLQSRRSRNIFNKTPCKFHYVWIKDFSALCNKQISKDGHKKHICERYFHAYYTEEKLKNHEKTCMDFESCKVKLPSPGKTFVSFKNHKIKLKAPFIM